MKLDDQIVDILRNLGAKQLIDELAQTISSSLTSGNTNKVNSLMAENNLEWNDVGWITRSSQLPFNVTSTKFTNYLNLILVSIPIISRVLMPIQLL